MNEEKWTDAVQNITMPQGMAEEVYHNCMNDYNRKSSKPTFNKWIASAAALLLFVVVFSSVTCFNVYAGVEEEVVIFFDEGISAEKVEEIQEQIKRFPDVISVKYVDSEEAWEDFAKKYLDEEMMKGFTENPLKDSSNYRLKIKRDADMKELESQIQALDGVRKVNIKGE